jgi:hypothetical protein
MEEWGRGETGSGDAAAGRRETHVPGNASHRGHRGHRGGNGGGAKLVAATRRASKPSEDFAHRRIEKQPWRFAPPCDVNPHNFRLDF